MVQLSEILSEVEMICFKNKKCQVCGTEYTPKGPASKFCQPCSTQRAKDASRRHSYQHKLDKGLIKNPGVGKGGSNAKGVEDSCYKTGIAFFQRSRQKIRLDRKLCERCGKNLLKATRFDWVVHHKDHNRENNTLKNFELLCKRCHQLEHDCISSLPVQRPRQECL